MADINLMPTEARTSESFNSLQKKLTIFSTVILVAVAIFTVVTLVLFTVAKGEEAKQKARIEKASAEVNSYQSTEELLTVVDKKVKTANKVLGSRLVYTDIMNKVAELMPQDVYFGDLRIEGNKITTSAKARTSAHVAGLVSSFVSSEKGKKLFSNVNIDSLATDQDGFYAFAITMQVINPSVPGGGEVTTTQEN